MAGMALHCPPKPPASSEPEGPQLQHRGALCSRQRKLTVQNTSPCGHTVFSCAEHTASLSCGLSWFPGTNLRT